MTKEELEWFNQQCEDEGGVLVLEPGSSSIRRSSAWVDKRVDAERFIEVVQASETYEEAAKTLGIKVSSLRTRVRNYANKGVPLRKLVSAESQSSESRWERLSKLAQDKLPEGVAHLEPTKAALAARAEG